MIDKNEFEELIERHLRGELDESEKEQLAELLDSDPMARRQFVEYVQWDTRFAGATQIKPSLNISQTGLSRMPRRSPNMRIAWSSSLGSSSGWDSPDTS